MFINITSWEQFKREFEKKTKLEKGRAFEGLVKYYLLINETYQTKFKNVWLREEIPSSVNKKLNLPKTDQGIDLIAETNDGSYWAVQCKYLQDEDQRLSHRAISTFISLSTGIAENISHCLVCTTVDDYAKIYHGKKNISFINSDTWRKLGRDFFDKVRAKSEGKKVKTIPFKPKPHQERAIKDAKEHFVKEKNERGKLVFPCGAGKSLTGYWITRELKPKSIIVAVPSLSLVKQTLEVYLRESVANNDRIEWLCVCSDEGLGKNDDVAIHTSDMGVPCITDKKYISNWLKEHRKNKTIIFTTYQSGKVIAEASRIAKHEFDLGIMDEAHKTVGDKEKLFSHLLFDRNIKIRKRIFMTATERRYAGSSETVLSMDDLKMYGDTFTQMSFKDAIDIGILSDYKIITLFISNEEVRRLIEQNAFVRPEGKEWDKETEARTLASLIALRKAMKEYPIHHAVTFHSSIKKAEAFDKSQDNFSSVYPQYGKIPSFHVSGAMNTSHRGKIVDEFAEAETAIITNAKCLTEGVDVPNIDCVLFADPRKSTVDIVQAVGRALRRKEGKEFGYVILPVFTESKTKDEIIESEEFKEILATIRALASNDERITEEFRDISKGVRKNKKDSLIHFDLDINISERINENELISSLELKAWDKLAKLSWMPFEEAREFVRRLGLNSFAMWKNYSLSELKPKDLPRSPDDVYKKNGWISWGDFLGTSNVAFSHRNYQSFIKARSYVQSLNLKSQRDWLKYCKSKEKPMDIPSAPHIVYKGNGWIGYGDWLGTNTMKPGEQEYLNYTEAKEFVNKLELKNEFEWRQYSKSSAKPLYIPATPSSVYKESGWTGIGDWLGVNNKASQKRKIKTFDQARSFVHKLNLKTAKEWNEYIKSKDFPFDLPKQPRYYYRNEGWQGMGDWLGTNKIADHLKVYRDFADARTFVRSLNLKTLADWQKYCQTELKPEDIPAAPWNTYRLNGWSNIGDWLGTNTIANQNRKFWDYTKAKLFISNWNLKNEKEYKEFAKSKNRPMEIPYNPDRTYKEKGWKGWADFLGKESSKK